MAMWKVLASLLLLAPSVALGGVLAEQALGYSNGEECSSNSSVNRTLLSNSHSNYSTGVNVDVDITGTSSLTADDVSGNANSNHWPMSKPLPPLNPTSKTVLFVAHFFVSTDVNHMLFMAEELRNRGHNCEFVVMAPFVKAG